MSESSILDLITKYQEELGKDVEINELNMKDAALSSTTVKHKWVGRLIRHKSELKKLEKARDKAVSIVYERLKESGDVSLSNVMLKRQAEQNETVVKIDEQIEDVKLLVEYLEKVEKIVTSVTWDLKNIIDLVKLETQ
jgi:hypothetical protein